MLKLFVSDDVSITLESAKKRFFGLF